MMAEMGHNIHHPKQNKTKNSQSGTLMYSNKSPNHYALSWSIDHAKLTLQP